MSSASFFTRDVDVDFLFSIADYDKDGVININDATRFFLGANLSIQEMGTIWAITVTNLGLGVLTKENFGKSLTLISLTQKRLPLTAASLSPGVLDPPMFMDLDPTDRAKYEVIFTKVMDPTTQKVSGQTALSLFTSYGIDRQILFKIWQLSDMDLDGSLTGAEFLVAMALIKCVMSGNVVPNVVPSTLLYSIINNKSVNAEEVKTVKSRPKMPVAATQSMFVGSVAATSPTVMQASSSSISSSPSPTFQQNQSQSQDVNLFDDKDSFFSSTTTSSKPSSKSNSKSASTDDLFSNNDNNLFPPSTSSTIQVTPTITTQTAKETVNTSNLFDDKDSFFSSTSSKPSSKSNSKSASTDDLFSNNDNNLFPPSTSSTIQVTPTITTQTTIETANTSNLFDDKDSFFSSTTTPSKSTIEPMKTTNLFDNNDNLFPPSTASTIQPTTTKMDLFDNNDNLFPSSTTTTLSSSSSTTIQPTATPSKSTIEPMKTTNLFDNNDNLFNNNDIIFPSSTPSTITTTSTSTSSLPSSSSSNVTTVDLHIDTEELKQLDEKIAAIQKEFNDIHESVETKKVQAQTIKDRNASLVTQQEALQHKCKSIQDEAALREMDLEHVQKEIEKNKSDIKAAEDGIEESTRNIAEAKAQSEKLGAELGAALTRYSNAFTANSTQREMLTKEKEKLRAAETAKLPDNPLDALPKSRIFGPEFVGSGGHKKDPFDTSDMVMQAPNLWYYEPFKIE